MRLVNYLSTILIGTLLFLILCNVSKANTLTDTTVIQANHPYSKVEVLYLTLDKTMYLPGEVLWFSGCLLNPVERAAELTPDILSVALLRSDTTAFALQRNYLMQAGLCKGSLTLPDTLPPGDYTLVAASNILDSIGRPIHVFQTDITVKSLIVPQLYAAFEVEDAITQDSIFVRAKVWSSDLRLALDRKSAVEYRLSNGWKGKMNLDAIGRARIGIPVAQVDSSDRIVYTRANYGKASKRFNLRIPDLSTSIIAITTSVDGGALLADIEQQIAWQSLRNSLVPHQVKAVLYEDQHRLMSIQTDSDGRGSFKFTPQHGSRYQIVSEDDNYSFEHKLPVVTDRGMHIHLTTTFANDTLKAILTPTQNGNVQVSIKPLHEERELVGALDIADSKKKKLIFPLNGLAKGLHRIVMSNEKKDTLATSYLFNRPQDSLRIALSTDREQYDSRDQVSGSISVQSRDGKVQKAMLSVYCVLKSRLDTARKATMPSYFYWDYWSKRKDVEWNHLEQIEKDPHKLNFGYQYFAAKASMPRAIQKAYYTGQVALRDDVKKPIDSELNLLIKRDSAIGLARTDSTGRLLFDAANITVRENGRMTVFASPSEPRSKLTSKDYRINVQSEMQTPMGLLEKELVAKRNHRSIPLVQSDTSLILKGQPTRLIEEVTVYARARDVRQSVEKNECGDYVCIYGILNCQNHPFGGTLPVKGQYYIINGVRQAYAGCEKEGDDILQLYTAQDFQGMSAAEISDKTGETYLSTLLWKPQVYVEGNETFRFFTSDLEGDYRIIVEGITESGEVIYGQKDIKIKRKM